jgi:4-aminobutyrate aminotransferase-like enzyme/Ser/Thr protein kinase RdoA (MazF antagonist)
MPKDLQKQAADEFSAGPLSAIMAAPGRKNNGKESMVMALANFAPTFTKADAARLAHELFGVSGSVECLPSERDQNFLVTRNAGERLVLKIANAMEERALLEAQNQAMEHVSQRVRLLPNAIHSLKGELIETASAPDGRKHFVRLLTYLRGTPMGSVKRHSAELLRDLGRKLGLLDGALQGFDHAALHREFYWDVANGLRQVKKNAGRIRDGKLLAMVRALTKVFEDFTVPLLPRLRASVVYNDANDFNVLLGGGDDIFSRDQSVTGFIDLGDMVHGYTVGDLAVAIAYAILDKPDPLAAAGEITRGYHSTFPLTEDEISALFGFVALRLCMSVCIAAEQQQSQPGNEYLGISQPPIRATLPRLMKLHPRFAEAVFRNACGLPPFASSPGLGNWLRRHGSSFAPVLPAHLWSGPPLVFDLSIGSPLLHGDPQENSEAKLTPRLDAALAAAGAKIGIGRYNEARCFYTSPAFATGDDPSAERRTVHLGIDLFAKAGTPVRAPLAGRIAAFADNDSPQDYGPVIVLEHDREDGKAFYTLYGHLSRRSLAGLKPGMPIRKGAKLASIGEPSSNGGWPPHLHFQVMTDLLELGPDFPGVAPAGQREVWQSLCPDPNLILGIPEEAFPEKDPTKEETLHLRRGLLGGNLSISYRMPLKIVRGWMQYLYDEEGRRYIDAFNNVAHVGHCHPRVVEAACRQMGVLNTNTRYLHDNIIRYAEKLTSLLPESLPVCYFVNSASEANELALRLARAATAQRDMVVLEAAYHGNTTTLIDISPYKHDGPGGGGAPDWVHAVPIPDVFRGEYKADDPQAGSKYAAHVQRAIESLQARGRGLAGFIAESLPSVGGQIIFPEGYLSAVYRHVRKAGGVCIADEVQTGFGRVGSHLWGFEMQHVVPDIVVLGKPIGNGHPLAAVVTRRDIAEAFNNGMEYFATFGGNPVSCAVGSAVLDVLIEEGLQEHAKRLGTKLLNGLKPMVGKYKTVADVRGAGLFLGVELVRDFSTLEPAEMEASFLCNLMREHGILVGTDGPYHNVVKIRPPMPFNESDAEYLLGTFEKILQEDFQA